MYWNHIMDKQPENNEIIIQLESPYEGDYIIGIQNYHQDCTFEDTLKFRKLNNFPNPDFWWISAKDFPFPYVHWVAVKSKSDKHPEFGYPMGDRLFRSLQQAQEYIKKSGFNDCYVEDYTTIKT